MKQTKDKEAAKVLKAEISEFEDLVKGHRKLLEAIGKL